MPSRCSTSLSNCKSPGSVSVVSLLLERRWSLLYHQIDNNILMQHMYTCSSNFLIVNLIPFYGSILPSRLNARKIFFSKNTEYKVKGWHANWPLTQAIIAVMNGVYGIEMPTNCSFLSGYAKESSLFFAGDYEFLECFSFLFWHLVSEGIV